MGFKRRVNYYETDKMGITHHSNYIRWMEEARVDFLNRLGYGLKRLESDGITSPVVTVDCRYKRPTTFDDLLDIKVAVKDYTGVKLTLSYIMSNAGTGETVFTAESSHCFIDGKGRPISVKKHFAEFDALLRAEAERARPAGA